MSESENLNRRDVLKLGLLGGSAFLLGQMPLVAQDQKKSKILKAKDFSVLSSAPPEGLSESQIQQHLGLYKGYVNKFNKSTAQIQQEISRSLFKKRSYAYGGVVLHELYFGNMRNGSAGLLNRPAISLGRAIRAQYGSVENLLDRIEQAGRMARGWVIWGYNLFTNSFELNIFDSHVDGACLYGIYPLLVLDVYEHAYMIDFGTDKASYLEIFIKNINWSVISERYQDCARASVAVSL